MLNSRSSCNRDAQLAIVRRLGVAPVLHWQGMPTSRRRHAVTETPRVQAALTALRAELGNDRVDLAEIVVLGAELKLHQLRIARGDRAERLRSLAQRVRTQTLPVDADAAATVRRTGWSRG